MQSNCEIAPGQRSGYPWQLLDIYRQMRTSFFRGGGRPFCDRESTGVPRYVFCGQVSKLSRAIAVVAVNDGRQTERAARDWTVTNGQSTGAPGILDVSRNRGLLGCARGLQRYVVLPATVQTFPCRV